MAREPDDTKESRRILDRIDQETGNDFVSRTGHRLGDHLKARDADQQDRIEVLGTRIGRTIGFLITVGIIIWLLWYLMGGGG